MRINHNIAALNTYRQLGNANQMRSESMQKLSSGLRINSAADDAAGLAISEKMRGQIRGLEQAQQNSQDGISMIQTAEGALNETHSILQRMRELAVQASNDTNTSDDRAEIQKEINQLSSEINRIGNTTEFNTKSLLKGDGTTNLDATGLNFDAITTSVAGKNAVTNEAAITIDLGTDVADTATLTVDLNGRKFTATFSDAGGNAGDVSGLSSTGATVDLGGATSTSGNDNAVTTGTADALQQWIDSNADLKGNYKVTDDGAGTITISAVKGGEFEGSKGSIQYSGTGTGTFTVKNDAGNDGTIDDTLNPNTLELGKDTAATSAYKDIDLSGLSSTDIEDLVGKGLTINGQQIEFYDADKGAYTGEALGIDISDAASGSQLVAAIETQAGSKLEGVTLSDQTSGVLRVSSNDTGADSSVEITDGGVNEEFKATFQVGANENQSMTISISDMRSEALGITGEAGAEGFTAAATVTDGTNDTKVEAALDVSTHESASAAITALDEAIAKVSSQRSELGAFQNRLDHTINNLGTSAENLTAAESRIRDVDMAKEMMQQTKASILAQASQAMLAQANQMPQGVLQLLR